MITFSDIGIAGSSKYIKVYKNYKAKPNHSRYNELKRKIFKIQIGRISYTTENELYYYEPPANTSSAILTAENIENLKNKITNRRNNYMKKGRWLT
jgi:hypothetical protein